METKVIKVGNSKGIIIPAKLLKILGLKDKVKLKIEGDQLLISSVEPKPRQGWEQMIKNEIKNNGQPDKLVPDFFEDEGLEEWTW